MIFGLNQRVHVFFLFIVLLYGFSQAQYNCQPYIHNYGGRPRLCDTIIANGTIIALRNNTMDDLYTQPTRLEPFVSLASDECLDIGVPYFCLATFNPCTAFAEPIKQCSDDCYNFTSTCETELRLVGIQPDCTDTLLVSPVCESNNQTFNISRSTECPEPLIYDSEASDDFIKCFKCPPPFFSQKVWSSLYTLTLVVCCFGFALQLFSLIVVCSDKTYFTFSSHFWIIYIIDSMVASFLGALSSVVPQKIICENEGRGAEALTHWPCAVQGFLLTYVTIQLFICWAVHSVTLVFNLQRSKKALRQNSLPLGFRIISHCCIWLLPLLNTTISLILGNIKSVFFSCYALGKHRWYLFLGFPLVPALIITTFCFGYIVYESCVLGSQRKQEFKNKATKITLAVFSVLVTLWILLALMIILRAWVDMDGTDRVSDLTVEYIKCIFTKPIQECELIQKKSESYLIVLILSITCAFGSGVIFFPLWIAQPKFRKSLRILVGLQQPDRKRRATIGTMSGRTTSRIRSNTIQSTPEKLDESSVMERIKKTNASIIEYIKEDEAQKKSVPLKTENMINSKSDLSLDSSISKDSCA